MQGALLDRTWRNDYTTTWYAEYRVLMSIALACMHESVLWDCVVLITKVGYKIEVFLEFAKIIPNLAT